MMLTPDANEGPLAGIRVLDLTRVVAGPYCTMLLGDFGAEVIKVEEPNGGDELRALGPPFLGEESVFFLSVNRNKKSVTLDLKSDDRQGSSAGAGEFSGRVDRELPARRDGAAGTRL